MAETTKKSPCSEIRNLVERHDSFWRPIHDAMDEEENFLDGDRYEDDNGDYNRDRRLTQIRGQEIQDTIRHVVAQATSKPRNIEVRAIDNEYDADGAEIAASLVERELSDPWKGFEDCYEDCIVSAREKRLGVVWMDWVPDHGPYGEIFYSFEDPRRIRWDPAYDPHHPMCGWLLRERRMGVDEANERYGVDYLKPDRDYLRRNGNSSSSQIRLGRDNAQIHDDDKVTIWECWYKNDASTVMKESGYRELPADQQYMSCMDGCGFRSDPGPDYPEMQPGACPMCGGNLDRIDAVAQDEQMLMYSKGKRLVVMAPYCPGPGDKPLADGAWPIPGSRSFPGLFITAYPKPGRAVGVSDTYLMWDQQIASDQLRTAALQRVLEHRNYWVMPRTGIVDYRNKRFEFRDDQFNVMYRDMSKADMGPLQVDQINGTGLDPAFGQVFSIIQQALVQYRGVTDFGITPESSKDLAVGTVERLTQQGEIPVEHFNRRKNRALGKFYGVVWDYIRATYTPKRLSRLNIEGTEILAKFSGDDFPNFDFVISDTPPFTGIEKARADAAKALLQMAQGAPPELVSLYAELMNLPPSIARKIENAMTEMRDQQALEAPESPDGGQDMSGSGMVPDPMSEVQPNG